MFREFTRVPFGIACALFVLLTGAVPASAQVRISQIYGAGGNAGAALNSDYVELFNAGAAPASIAVGNARLGEERMQAGRKVLPLVVSADNDADGPST